MKSLGYVQMDETLTVLIRLYISFFLAENTLFEGNRV